MGRSRRAFGISVLFAAGVSAMAAQDAPPPSALTIPMARLKADAVVATRMDAGGVATDDGVWLPDRGAGTVVRIDAKSNAPGAPVAVGGPPCASLAWAFGSVWVPRCEAPPQLARFDAAKGTPGAAVALGPSEAAGRIAAGVGSVWVASDARGVVSRIDPDTNAVVAEIHVAPRPSSLLLDGDALWVTSADGDVLTRISPHSTEVGETVKLGTRPGRLAAGEGGVWVLNGGDGTVSRVDPAATKVVATIRVADGAVDGDVAVGGGSVWVSLPGVPLIRLDPRTNRAVQRFTGDGGGAILFAHGSVWVNAGPSATWRLDPRLVAAMRPD